LVESRVEYQQDVRSITLPETGHYETGAIEKVLLMPSLREINVPKWLVSSLQELDHKIDTFVLDMSQYNLKDTILALNGIKGLTIKNLKASHSINDIIQRVYKPHLVSLSLNIMLSESKVLTTCMTLILVLGLVS